MTRLSAQQAADFCAQHDLALPQTKRGWTKRLDEEGWTGSVHCHERRLEKGGRGHEYELCAFGEAFVAAWQAAQQRAVLAKAERDDQSERKRQLTAVAPMTLSARQRSVMEARAKILLAIEARQQSDDLSRSRAIAAFIAGPMAFDIADAVRITANDRRTARATISRRTVYGWFALRDEGGVAALAPRPTRTARELDETDWFGDFLPFYARPSKPDITTALRWYAETLDDPAKAPSYGQARRALGKLNAIERHVGREGLLTLKSRMAYVSRSTKNLLPTTIYTADGKTFDAEVAHPVHGRAFKPEITSVVDVATRVCVSVAISLSENTIAVTEALRKAAIGHGIPAIFYVDRGPGYKNKTLDADVSGLMARLSITKMHSLPRNSQARGLIERFHGTAFTPLAKSYPTYCGADMDPEAQQRAFKQSRADLAAFGSSRLLKPWDEFRLDVEAAVAAYNDTPHSGLPEFVDKTGRKRHYSPNEFWAAQVATGFQPVPVDPDEIDDLFRPYEMRTVRRALIEWNRNRFFHMALEPLHGEKVLVGYDLDDANHVWVRRIDRDAEGAMAPGALICVAKFAGNEVDYVPRSFQKAAEERRAKGRLARIDAKRRDVEAELSPGALIEHQDADVIAFPAVDLAAEAPVEVDALPIRPASAKQFFSEDWELALHALQEGLDGLHERQRSTLKRCLNTSADRELFRLKGVDLGRLEALFRDAA